MSTASSTSPAERPLESVLREKREEVLAIADRHGAVNVRLFGSVARGAARPGSDVDFLVDIREPVDAWFPGGLIADLEELLGCRVDVVPESMLVLSLRPAVLASAIPLDRPLPNIPLVDPSIIVKDDRLYLEHILESIVRVEVIAGEGWDTFAARTLHQDAALRNLQTMAESTQRLSEEARARHPEVDWAAIARFRNKLAHGYLHIDLRMVWSIIEEKLPALKTAVSVLMSEG